MKQDHDDDKLKKDDQSAGGDQPWQKKFMDSRDDTGNLSRSASRHREKNMTSFAVILAIILALMMLAPMTYWAVTMKNGNGNTDANKITMTDSQKSSEQAASSSKAKAASEAKAKSEKAAAKKSSEEANKAEQVSSEASSASAASSSSSAAPAQSQNTQNAASSSSTPAAQSSSQQAASSSTPAASGGTYTVKAGENPYRIAVNHGMTLAELYALNPTVQTKGIIPGQVLKLK